MHQHFVSRFASVMTATTVVMWMSVVALPSAQRSDTEGIKEAEKFVDAGADTVKAAGKTREQIQKTLAAYNALVTEPSTDLKGDFKKLLNGAKDMDEEVADARERITKMQTTGDTYFAGRAVAMKEIQNADLLEKAQRRLDENKQQFAGVIASLRETGQAFQTLRTDLDDQIKYVGSDLTPSAMTSLTPEAQKLNARGGHVLADADRAMTTASNYFNSMRPAKS